MKPEQRKSYDEARALCNRLRLLGWDEFPVGTWTHPDGSSRVRLLLNEITLSIRSAGGYWHMERRFIFNMRTYTFPAEELRQPRAASFHTA